MKQLSRGCIKMKKETGIINWAHIEFLFYDRDYQHALQILKKFETLDRRLDRILEKCMLDRVNDKNSIYDVFSGIH